MNVKVAISLNIPEPLTYSVPAGREDIHTGDRVVVPVGRRLETGWIVGLDSSYSGRVRPVIGGIRDNFRLPVAFVEFCLHAGRRFLVSPGRLLDAALSPKRRNRKQIRLEGGGADQGLQNLSPAGLEPNRREFPLSFTVAARNLSPGPSPLDGGPGSGRFTEQLILSHDRIGLYAERIAEFRKNGRSVVIVTADNAGADEISGKIPDALAYHSAVPAALREKHWGRAVSGEAVVVVGGQSALMLPIANLGAVIVEHPAAWTYRGPDWDVMKTPELARLRAAYLHIPLIHGDNVFPLALYRRRTFLEVSDDRSGKGVAIRVFPIPPGRKGIPESFMERIVEYSSRDQRVLVLVNRRKGDDFLFCPQCRKAARCGGCGRWLKPESQTEPESLCPECSAESGVRQRCPACNGEWVEVRDISLDSVAEAIRRRVTGEVPGVVTAQTGGGDVSKICHRSGPRVVLGTASVLSPEFRAAFDAVIYLKPESVFHFTQHDAAERIHAVVGRLRELVSHAGVVDVFSAFHFHYALQSLEDEPRFLERESKYRAWFQLPPFADLFEVAVKSRRIRELGAAMREIVAAASKEMTTGEVGLVSRIPLRGFYHGRIELRGLVRSLRESGIVGRKNTVIKRL